MIIFWVAAKYHMLGYSVIVLKTAFVEIKSQVTLNIGLEAGELLPIPNS